MTERLCVHGAAWWTEEEGDLRPALLPPRLRRRTSPLTRAVAEVVARLQAQTGVDPAKVPMIHASAMGEIGTTLGLLAMMQEGNGAVSPTRFHNSVHNTAAGYVSIATGNRGFSTALAAGSQTPAMALVEAFSVIHAGATEVMVIVAEETLPAPLLGPAYESLAVALHLGAAERGGDHLHLSTPRIRSVPDVPALPPTLAKNPCAPAWALSQALEIRRVGNVSLEAGKRSGERGWCVEIAEAECV